MLDDLKYIHEKDVQDALGIAEKQWRQLQQVFNVDVSSLAPEAIQNVVVAGMGGSALAAELSKSWPGYAVPFEVSRDYAIPLYVDQNTLFIASSYSGNTEETIAALEKAVAKHAQVVVITDGGELEEIAKEQNYPLYMLPGHLQPRHAVLANYKAILTLLAQTSLVDFTTEQLEREVVPYLVDWIQDSVKPFLPTVPTKDNLAKQLAQECMGKSIVIYSGPLLYSAAYKWKINMNENAKNVAWCNFIPEFNHNEFLGWTSHPTQKPYAVIELRSKLDHPHVQKRFEVTERLLSGQRPSPEVVEVQGDSLAQQLLWAVLLGDFVSLYLALLNGLNPTPVDLIEKFKKALKD